MEKKKTALSNPEQAPRQQPLVITSRRLLAFTESGEPTIINQNLEKVNRQLVDKVNFSALMLPYKGKKVYDFDEKSGRYLKTFTYDLEDFDGMTNLEVAAIQAASQAADGNFDVYKSLLERVAGKAVEKSLSMTTKLDYKEFLEQLSSAEPQSPAQPQSREYIDLL